MYVGFYLPSKRTFSHVVLDQVKIVHVERHTVHRRPNNSYYLYERKDVATGLIAKS